MQLDRGNREDEQAEPDVAEQPLDPLERQGPRDDEEPDHARARSGTRYGRPESSWSTIATPPTSAAQVIRFTTEEATSVPSPALKPTRSRTRSNTGRFEIAATRPHISEYTMIPMTPIDDDPEELKAEGRAGLRVEDEVADVDEAADRGEDPERDLQELLHELLAAIVARSCLQRPLLRRDSSPSGRAGRGRRAGAPRARRAAAPRAVLPAASVVADFRALARR